MISDIISALGFLRDISNEAERKEKEEKLFQFIKILIIEILEMVETEEKREALFKDYNICLMTNSNQGYMKKILQYEAYKNCSLFLACCHIIQIKYKLTETQMFKIVDIIKQMKPYLIYYIYINCPEDKEIAFFAPNEDYLFIDTEQEAFINIDKITDRIDEIQKGDWDNTIKTRIKELG